MYPVLWSTAKISPHGIPKNPWGSWRGKWLHCKAVTLMSLEYLNTYLMNACQEYVICNFVLRWQGRGGGWIKWLYEPSSNLKLNKSSIFPAFNFITLNTVMWWSNYHILNYSQTSAMCLCVYMHAYIHTHNVHLFILVVHTPGFKEKDGNTV